MAPVGKCFVWLYGRQFFCVAPMDSMHPAWLHGRQSPCVDPMDSRYVCPAPVGPCLLPGSWGQVYLVVPWLAVSSMQGAADASSSGDKRASDCNVASCK